MAKGKKTDDLTKEQIIAVYATCGNINETARTLNLAKSLVFRVINEPERSKLVERVRTEKRMEFADRASEIIQKMLDLTEQKTDELLRDKDLRDRTPLSQITTAAGTLFDKRALARGESTSNNSINISLSGELKEWAE